jgi:hypothetical protein
MSMSERYSIKRMLGSLLSISLLTFLIIVEEVNPLLLLGSTRMKGRLSILLVCIYTCVLLATLPIRFRY